ncbi:MAG TPA: FAD/NAD(P)-binding protein [Candidatus Methylomirabilis sp.]|nr:FAD/NAD(P)-binding protein [Candidatus Methylomirabilis sp.]
MAPSLAPSPASLLPRFVPVRRVRRELRDTWTLELDAGVPDGVAPFQPGQFNMIYAFGVGEVAISISGDPARPDSLAHTVRSVGAVTRAITSVKKGGVLGLRGPFGNAWPVAEAEGRDVVVVAGGLGLAPLRPVMYAVLAARERYGRVVLLIGARTPADLLFSRELERWRGRFDIEVRVTVDAAPPDWNGEVGLVTALIARASFDPARAISFVCGPEVMMRFVAAELVQRGVPAAAIHLSLERNMKCAVGVCGHCQLGPAFVCKDGPVLVYERVERLLRIREI